MTSPSSSEQPYVRPRDYWCNVDEEVRIIEAALDLYEQTTMGQPASESEERRLLREVTEGVLEQYAGDGTHRQWGRMTWLYPGTRIVEIDGKTWAAIDALLARPTPSHTAAPISPSGGNGPAPSEKPCATCNDDPAVCATVPGLRHCEKAMRGSALSEYRSSEKPREGAGLRKFLEQGCDARPEDRHHAMQDLDQLERELSDWRDRANRVIKERDRLAVSAIAPHPDLLDVLAKCRAYVDRGDPLNDGQVALLIEIDNMFRNYSGAADNRSADKGQG